jgi:hypothetical protein
MTATPVESVDRCGFSPYVLFRRGTLGLAALAGVVPERTWSLLTAAQEAGERRDAMRAELEQALHDAVPTLSPEHRRTLLALRRAVHNDRNPPAAVPAELPQRCQDLLADWTRARRSGETLLTEAEQELRTDLDAARKVLAEVACGEDFQRGLQLSGEDLHREVMAFAADPFDPRRKPSRRRRAESTIVSYAYRVVFKPSPFGSFTEIGAQPWEPGRGTSTVTGGNRLVSARLNIGLVTWLAQRLRHIDGADDLLRIRLNNSLTVDGDQATFIRRPVEGTDDAFQPDKVISARHTDLVRLLVDVLGGRDASQRELRDALVAAGLAPPAATLTIDNLVKVGLCHRDLGMPDQTVRPAAAVAQRLRRLPGSQAADCASVFEHLQDIEDRYADADAGRRTALLADLRAQVHMLVDICGGPAPQPEAMRAAVYEDVGTRAAAQSWRPDVLAGNRDNLALYQRLLPLLDEATVEKLGLYRFFTRCYGTTTDPVDLVTFYRAFAELGAQAAGALMSGTGDPQVDRIRALRRHFFDLLERGDLALGGTAGAELHLEPARMRAFVDTLPTVLPAWRSAAYRVQFAAGPERTLAVLNGVTTGHGVFFSRFCDLLHRDDAEQWELTDHLRRHIARTTPRQTDVTATMGLNFNLHPRLTPYELVYPGSVARTATSDVLTLADVAVRADPAAGRLQLLSKRDGQRLDLVPLNFLYPAAAPMLYRFLCGFAPTRTYRGGLWDQVDRAGGAVVPTGRPRVSLGDLILDRQSWRVPVGDLPDLDRLERQDTAALTAYDRWRRGRGIPCTAFFRIQAPPPAPGGERDVLTETRRWALEARSARLHKPHYIDAYNPFLVYILAKQARSCAAGTLVFHECLPAAEEYGDAGGAANAEEFFVEHQLPGGDHVGG